MISNAWKLGVQKSDNRTAWSGEVGYNKATSGKSFAGYADTKEAIRGANERKDQRQTYTISQSGKDNTKNSLLPTSQNNTLLEKFKNRLVSRGARGIVGLQKQFKIMDDNNNKLLE